MAISAIPTGMPAFVSGLLSLGAKQLAEARAVVKNLTDVETLGATSAINTDKTGTLTMNEMMVSTIYADGNWFTVTGQGYEKTGTIESVAGVPVPDFTRLALGLVLDTDATVGDDGTRDRRPDRGRARRAGGEARRQRRGDAPRLPAARRGAVRLGLQVHGHVPPRHRRRGRARDRAGQGRPRRRLRPLHARPAARSAARRCRSRTCARSSTRPTRAWARRACACSPSRRG